MKGCSALVAQSHRQVAAVNASDAATATHALGDQTRCVHALRCQNGRVVDGDTAGLLAAGAVGAAEDQFTVEGAEHAAATGNALGDQSGRIRAGGLNGGTAALDHDCAGVQIATSAGDEDAAQLCCTGVAHRVATTTADRLRDQACRGSARGEDLAAVVHAYGAALECAGAAIAAQVDLAGVVPGGAATATNRLGQQAGGIGSKADQLRFVGDAHRTAAARTSFDGSEQHQVVAASQHAPTTTTADRLGQQHNRRVSFGREITTAGCHRHGAAIAATGWRSEFIGNGSEGAVEPLDGVGVEAVEVGLIAAQVVDNRAASVVVTDLAPGAKGQRGAGGGTALAHETAATSNALGDEGLGASAGGRQPGRVLHGHGTGTQVAGAVAAHQDQIGVSPRRGVAATAANALH